MLNIIYIYISVHIYIYENAFVNTIVPFNTNSKGVNNYMKGEAHNYI